MITKNTFSIGTLFSIVFYLTISVTTNAQNSFFKSVNAYLGQKPPVDTPEIFAQGVLHDFGIVLGRVTFSEDGTAFYYSFAQHWFDDRGSGTKEIKFSKGKWQTPVVIAENITNPAFSPDYKTLYLGGSNGQVWLMRKTKSGWMKPKLWMQKSYGLYNFQTTNSGAFYVGSNGTQGSKKDWNTYDFCKLTIKRKDTLINSLGPTLNTKGFDGDFFIAPDESYIIISANETKDFECELWISFRRNDESWTEPQSLGNKINDGLAHQAIVAGADNNGIVHVSHRRSPPAPDWSDAGPPVSPAPHWRRERPSPHRRDGYRSRTGTYPSAARDTGRSRERAG